MARVTVEDVNVGNRFELVLLAAQRAKNLMSGIPVSTNEAYKKDEEKRRKKEKVTVISLRELAASSDSKIEEIRNELRKSWQTQNKAIHFEEDAPTTEELGETSEVENFDYELENSDFYNTPSESDDLIFGWENNTQNNDNKNGF